MSSEQTSADIVRRNVRRQSAAICCKFSEIAKNSGISRERIYHLTSGRNQGGIELSIIDKVASAIGVTPAELLDPDFSPDGQRVEGTYDSFAAIVAVLKENRGRLSTLARAAGLGRRRFYDFDRRKTTRTTTLDDLARALSMSPADVLEEGIALSQAD